MTVCRFYLQGTCKYGKNCRFEHTNQTSFQQQGVLRPSQFSNYAGDTRGWSDGGGSGRFQAGTGPFGGGSQQNSQQRGAGFGGQAQPVQGLNINEIINTITQEMSTWEKTKMWPFSCFGYMKNIQSLPGLEDLSMEEVRLKAYEANETGTAATYQQWLANLMDEYRTKRKQLETMDQVTKNHLLKFINSANTASSDNKDTKPSLFSTGTASSSPLNTNQPSAFGRPATQQSAFGTSAVFSNTGTTTDSSTFSNSGNSVFGAQSSSTSVFGSTNSPAGSSVFGNSGQSSVFGGSGPAGQQSTSVFGGSGASDPASNAFGAGAASNAAAAASVFGSGAAGIQGNNAFGSTPASDPGNMATGSSSSGNQGMPGFGGNNQPGILGASPAGVQPVFGGGQSVGTSQPGFTANQSAFVNAGQQIQTGQSAFSTTQPTFTTSQSSFINAGQQNQTGQSAFSSAGQQIQTGQTAFSSAGQQIQTGQAAFSTAGQPSQPTSFGMSPFSNTSQATSSAQAIPGSTTSNISQSQTTPSDFSTTAQPNQTITSGQPTGFGAVSTTPTGVTVSAPTQIPAPTTTQPTNSAFSSFSFAAAKPAVSSVAPQATGLFGKPASVTGSTFTHAVDKNLYTPLEQLTAQEREQFAADQFTVGKIPLRPPPLEMC